MLRFLVRILLVLLGVACLSATSGSSQLIPVRTVPLATGDQFLLFPSSTLAMGGLELAVDDSLADPWSNPAKGVFVTEPSLVGSPTFYSISHGGGGARSFPVEALFGGGGWSGGAGLAMQQLDNGRARDQGGNLVLADSWGWPGVSELLSDANARNLYMQAFVARRLGNGQWSVGLGVSASSLDALAGVSLLYPNSVRVVQSGGSDDVRLGLYRQGEADRLSLLVARSSISMTHDVTYLDTYWPPGIPSGSWGQPTFVPRVEHNADDTRTWAFQAAWDRSLSAPGWRVGVAATLNRKTHPKIPDYEIQNIPRDPGDTWAYELGVGVSRTRGGTTFGIDVALQPVRTNTWQVADTAVATPLEGTIPPGGKTVENDFSFRNVLMRVGLSHDVGRATLQAGLEGRSYDYDMDQKNHLTGTFRDQAEHWMEWTPSVGATLRFAGLELRYLGRATTGTGAPSSLAVVNPTAASVPTFSGDFLVAPLGPLTLEDATVWTQQISVRVPIR